MIIRLILALASFTLIFLLFGALWGEALTASIGNWLADTTSAWNYMDIEAFNDALIGGRIGHETSLQVIYPSETDMVAYRDLSTYYGLKEFKFPLIVALYFLGAVIIVIVMIRKPVHVIDDISQALASPDIADGKPFHLPKDLQATQAELQLLQGRILENERAAKEAEQRKNELVTYLAHDIRTPLTSVLGYLELISEGEGLPEEKQRAFAQAAFDKAERLEGLVEELFEITRYNLQSIPIEREWLDVKLLCEQIAEEFYPQAAARSLTIEVDAEGDLLSFLDSARMGRAVENVVKNAITHAQKDTSININAKRADGAILLTISNKGKEISAEHLEHIFERFYRGDSSRNQDSGNAGLGLAIAKKIVEAHGGTITAVSENGMTTFAIALPEHILRSGLIAPS